MKLFVTLTILSVIAADLWGATEPEKTDPYDYGVDGTFFLSIVRTDIQI